MARKRYSTEQVGTKLRQAEVELGRGLPHAPGLQEAEDQRANVLPLAEGVRRLGSGPGQAVKGTRAREPAAEEAGGRPGPGQRDPQRGDLGKLLSPPRRHQAVNHVCTRLGVSERRACRVMGHARSPHRHLARLPDDEPRLVIRMIEPATTYGR